MEEQWKDIKGYEGQYQVSNLGKVKSLARTINKHKYGKAFKKEILLKQYIRNGYYQVVLCKNAKYKTISVHRLVASVFIENKGNLPQVNHKDGNKTNNNVNNLEWCTKSYNLKEAYRLKLKKPPMPTLNKKGKDSYIAKKIAQIGKNGEVIGIFWGCYEAERQTGINKVNINKCCNGKTKTAGGYIWKIIK